MYAQLKAANMQDFQGQSKRLANTVDALDMSAQPQTPECKPLCSPPLLVANVDVKGIITPPTTHRQGAKC